MSAYQVVKGLSGPKIEKSTREKFVTLPQLKALLEAVKEQEKAKWRRDHCAIYLGFHFGLRAGEAVMLERDNFRFLDDNQVFLRTLKQAPRLPMRCPQCDRKWRVSAKRLKQKAECPRCAEPVLVKSKNPVDSNPPEKSPPVVEARVIDYSRDYLDNVMRDDQRWLLESTKGYHLSITQLRKIFNFYIMASGLPPSTSFHALRHGRGVLVYERFQDHVMTRDMLRQKSLSSAEWYMHLSPVRQAEYQAVLDGVNEEMGFE